MAEQGRPWRVPAWPLLAAVVGAAVGVGVGLAVAGVMRLTADPGNTWADLGAIVTGMLVAATVGAAVWVAGLVVAAWRLFPPGRRLVPVVWSVAVTLVAAVALSSLGGALADAGGAGGVWSATTVLLLLLPSLVFWLWWRLPSVGQPAGRSTLRSVGSDSRQVAQSPSIQPSGPGSSSAASGPHEPGA